jgi:hypothetical protein
MIWLSASVGYRRRKNRSVLATAEAKGSMSEALPRCIGTCLSDMANATTVLRMVMGGMLQV